MGEEPDAEDRLVTTTFQLSRAQLGRLRQMATARQISVAAVVRDAVRDYLDAADKREASAAA